jgi:hypothetical protein
MDESAETLCRRIELRGCFTSRASMRRLRPITVLKSSGPKAALVELIQQRAGPAPRSCRRSAVRDNRYPRSPRLRLLKSVLA